MELMNRAVMKKNYKNFKGEEVPINYDIFSIATDPGFADFIAKNWQNKVRLPGFRPGKVPRPMLEKQVGAANMYGEYLGEVWEQFCMENGVMPGAPSTIDNIHVRIDGAITFDIMTLLIPAVENLSVKDKYEIDVTQQVLNVVGQELRKKREALTVSRPVENRKTIWGDTVTVDFTGDLEGKRESDLCAEDAILRIGSGQIFVPGFEQALVDVALGESKTFEAEFPEHLAKMQPRNPRAKFLEGKKASFTVKMKRIEEHVVPTDEELAKSEGQETFLALYNDLVTKAFEDVQKQKDRVAMQIVDKLVEDNENLLSQSLNPAIVEERVQNFLASNKAQFSQLSDEEKQKTLERIQPNIIKSLLQDVVFNSLYQKLEKDISPTNEEVETRMKEMSRFMQGEVTNRQVRATVKTLIREKMMGLYADRVNCFLNKESEEYKRIYDSLATPKKLDEILESAPPAETSATKE